MTRKITLIAFFCLMGLKIFAQPSEAYLKSMNSLLPGSPESAQMMKYQDYPVSLFTGTPEISVPIFTCSGKGIAVPINISYHAGGGVKVDELPSDAGLGFNLVVGGEITRDMRGGPDEGGGSGTTGFMGKPQPISYYVNKVNCCTGLGAGYPDLQMWVNAMSGLFDLEPDLFYFSFGGYSGKFTWSDSLNKFICLTENSHINISFDNTNNPVTIFTIITDNGNKYIFANRETSYNQITNKGTAAGLTQPGFTTTTAWKLSKIINADGTDSIMFNYIAEHYSYYSGGSCINYQALSGPTRSPVLSFSNNFIDGEAKLSNVSGKNFSVDFIYESSDRQDVIGKQALSQIVIKNSNLDIQDIFVLHHSYFNRTSALGNVPITGNYVTKSLRLDSISEYGNSLSNPNPLRHAFTYNTLTTLPGRLSFQQDWWGYPNYNSYAESLVPPRTTIDNVPHPGANRTPDLDRVSAGILTGIRLPTGGTVTYEYEPNTTAIAVEQSLPDPSLIIPIVQNCSEFIYGASATFHDTTIYFTINQPANALNDFQGGVVAEVGIMPAAPTGTNGILLAYPYFTIDKTAEVGGGSIIIPFHQVLQTHGLTDIHMPNGVYTAKMLINNYNQNLPPLQPLGPTGVPYDDGSPASRNAGMTIGYDISDTSGNVINYSLAGVRVKKITTTDQYSNITNTRTFLYHNPVNDSSYGAFIGSARNYFVETSEFGQWQVFQGSYNLPGMGTNASNVVYPKVIEDVNDNGTIYRTEHYFSRGVLIYPQFNNGFPYAPSDDIEAARGNEYRTVWDKNYNANFTVAKMRRQVFDSFPHFFSDPNNHFAFQLSGVKCAATSYDQGLIVSQGYAPPYVIVYPISVANRTYLTSDSTITYDIVNPNNGIKEWHDYTYGDYSHQPIITRSGNSDGSVSILKSYYPSDQPDVNSVVNSILSSQSLSTQLIAANRVSEPLGSTQFKDGQLLSQQYSYKHFDANKLLIDSMRQALFGNPLDVEIKVDQYDGFANPLLIELRGGKYRKYIWNTDKSLPLATCVTSANNLFYFSSFEYANDGGTTGNSFSGLKAFQLNASHAVSIPSTVPIYNEAVFVWATTNDVYVNGTPVYSTGKVKGNWTLYKCHVVGFASPTTVPLPLQVTGTALIDQLIVLPAGSQFQGNIYDSFNRVMASVNDQIFTSFYEYDNFGRLTTIRDEQGNIVKSTSYQYQAAQ